VQYAFSRGIRVVPEFDVPAHTASWGKGYAELVAPCTGTLLQGVADGDFEKQIDKVAMRPLANTTWTFLEAFFREVLETFPDPYVHLGTDEVNGDCWVSDPDVAAYKAEHGYNWRTKLEAQFRRRLQGVLRNAARHALPTRRKRVRFVLWDSEGLSDIDPAPPVQEDDGDSNHAAEITSAAADAKKDGVVGGLNNLGGDDDEAEAAAGVALAQTWRFWDSMQPKRLHHEGCVWLDACGWHVCVVCYV
jgi:hypothetical protein